jgi:hypothetical protein
MDEAITQSILNKLNIKQKRPEILKFVISLTLSENISDVEKMALFAHFLFSEVFKYENGKWYQRDYRQIPPQWLEDPGGMKLNKFCSCYLIMELMVATIQINNIGLEAELEEKDQYLEITRKLTDLTYLFVNGDFNNPLKKQFLSVC